MYSVYLADDEQLIREGLAETIPWTSLGLTLVGTAEDGKQALKGIRQTRPDIILTDIRMPYMDGLELISHIRKLLPESHVVILTGHGEFSYAQSAIHLGVSDFILKPIDIQNLCRVLTHIRKKLDSAADRRNEVQEMRDRLQQADKYQFQRELLRYLAGRTPQQQFLERIPEELRRMRAIGLVLLQIDNFDHLTAAMDEESIFALTQGMEDSLHQIDINSKLVVVEESSGKYILLFLGDIADELSYEIRSFIRRLRMVQADLEFTTIASPVYERIEDCQKAYEFVCGGSDYAFQLGTNRDVQAEELKNSARNRLSDVPNVGRVIRSISTFNKEAIRKDFERLAEDIRKTGHNSYLYTHMLVSVVYGEITKLLIDINHPIDEIMENPLGEYQKILACTTMDGMLQLLYAFVAKICDYLDSNVNANKSVAERAKAYIEANYSNSNLTLDQVAGEMGISPNYFSALFKQSTNSSFISYLTKVRIAHAQELLKTGKYKTYEVAMRCGYENPTYFSTIFKRQTGVSPSEYRGGD